MGMDKLQYDSFYKFLVSLGVILIALPVVALVFVINGETLLLSQVEYDSLSAFSLESIHQREQLYDFIISWLPLATKILIPIGFVLVLIGGIKWYLIQLQLDEQTKSDTIMKRINAKNMSTTEIVAKVVEEVSDAEAEETEQVAEKTVMSSQRDIILKYMEIEELCFNKAVREYSKKYHLKKNVRVGKFDYDFIAVSKKDNVDILFEVKYWQQIPPTHITNSLAYKVLSAGQNYEVETHRNFYSIIIIVVPKQHLERMKNNLITRIENSQVDWTAEIQYVAEEDLK